MRRKVLGLRVVAIALLALALGVLVVPYGDGQTFFSPEERSCGSVLFPTYPESEAGPNAKAADHLTERSCREGATARVWAAVVLVAVGGFVTVVGFRARMPESAEAQLESA